MILLRNMCLMLQFFLFTIFFVIFLPTPATPNLESGQLNAQSWTDCHPDFGSSESRCISRGCVWSPKSIPNAPWCTFREDQLWIDCHPDLGSTESRCASRGCIWSPKSVPNAPWCMFNDDPARMAGYETNGGITNDQTVITRKISRRSTPSLFGDDFDKASVKIEQVTDEILRVIISDQHQTARPALYPKWRRILRPQSGKRLMEGSFDIQVDDSPFGFAVSRKRTNTTLIDTRRIPGFTFAKQYIQISTRVPTQYVYGLGEVSHEHMKHDFNYRIWSLYARDQPPGMDNTNLYGVHAFYLCIEDDTGNSHGIFILNTHAMNIALQPDPSNPGGGIITWRAIGGLIEFFILSGPTPDDVIRQYTSIISRPNLPPYWSLGYQLSRYGYKNLTFLEMIYRRNREAKIPQDTQVIDIDYMHKYMDYTTDTVAFKNFTGFIENLHAQNMKLVLIVDPAIASQPNGPYEPLDRGLKLCVFIMDNRTGKPLEGKVWPGNTYFPDFTQPNASLWWTTLIEDFYTKQGVQFDGLWIDMNEPSNFYDGSTTGCAENKYNNPPYNPLVYPRISDKTICADSTQFAGTHYELHNLYGYLEAKATYKALQALFRQKRPFILSRSTFPGSGKYTNHWTGDNRSIWKHLGMSIITMLEFNLFGIPMVGADICGFAGDTTEELCVRWHQLGAFYPFSRNHNDLSSKVEQDPAAWSKNGTKSIRTVLEYRYALLPYLYTLLYQAHLNGTPVARALFMDYPSDQVTRTLDDQFMWGSGLMIAPVLTEKTTNRSVYFPRGRWYDVVYFHEIPDPASGRSRVMDMSLYSLKGLGLYLRGGSVVPFQQGEVNTAISRKNPFWLLIGLDEVDHAEGLLYWDDGESMGNEYTIVMFSSEKEGKKGQVRVTPVKKDYVIKPLLETIYVYGMQSRPIGKPKIDGKDIEKFQYNDDKRVLVLDEIHADLNYGHVITWELA